MDMTRVEFLNASDEINKRPNEYWTLVMDIARQNTLARITKCCQIMGRSESDNLSASQIFYPCMQCADIFFLKVGTLHSLRFFACATVALLDAIWSTSQKFQPLMHPAIYPHWTAMHTSTDMHAAALCYRASQTPASGEWLNAERMSCMLNATLHVTSQA